MRMRRDGECLRESRTAGRTMAAENGLAEETSPTMFSVAEEAPPLADEVINRYRCFTDLRQTFKQKDGRVRKALGF